MHDIVVFGATGFVGKLIAEYLDKADVDLALAGRSREKLEALGIDRPLIVADADHPAELARSARVVATTVGPYRKGGIKLVDACVEAGTAYCDLTGEVLFAHDAIARHEAARASGARIVLSCGFDSIPSDLGTFLLHDAVGELGETTLVVKALRGGASGGTLASMKGQVDEMRADRAARRVIFDPHSLGGTDETKDFRSVARDPDYGWIGPFVMASYNTRIVRRSSELLGYGPDFALSRGVGLFEPGAWRPASPPGSARSPAASPSRRRASCSTACCPARATARPSRPARTASSRSRSTAPGTSPRSPPRVTRGTRRRR